MSVAGGVIELWRQDDHGNRFLVGRYASLADAERQLEKPLRVPHKQTYWLAPVVDRREKTEPA